jgi:hypothetical protein
MTREQAEQMWPIIKAFGEGKTVQYNSPCGGWEDIQEPQFFEAPVSYRIKPEYHLRPWKPEEVPVGATIRDKSSNNLWLIIWSTQTSIGMGGGKIHYSPRSIMEQCEYSLDHGKTWLPCGIEE